MVPTDDLKTLAALAREHGRVLAFRACEETGEFEPVLIRLGVGAEGASDEAAMIAITDANGMSLGNYVVSRDDLEVALAEAQAPSTADVS